MATASWRSAWKGKALSIVWRSFWKSWTIEGERKICSVADVEGRRLSIGSVTRMHISLQFGLIAREMDDKSVTCANLLSALGVYAPEGVHSMMAATLHSTIHEEASRPYDECL